MYGMIAGLVSLLAITWFDMSSQHKRYSAEREKRRNEIKARLDDQRAQRLLQSRAMQQERARLDREVGNI